MEGGCGEGAGEGRGGGAVKMNRKLNSGKERCR